MRQCGLRYFLAAGVIAEGDEQRSLVVQKALKAIDAQATVEAGVQERCNEPAQPLSME
jgi:hypothetical protein